MKKVLFYIDHRNRGGAQRVMVELANYFHNNKLYEVVFVAQNESKYNAYKLAGEVKEIVVGDSRKSNFIQKQMKRVKDLEKICQDEKPDIIISFLIITNIIALIVGKRVNIPVLISVRNDPTHDHSLILHVLMRMLYPSASGWVFQTEHARSYFERWIHSVADVIINPIATDVNDEIVNGMITNENEGDIVSVGRLDKQKRHDLLINAYAKVCKENNGSRLVIYGEGPERSNLEEQIERLGLKDRVILRGVTENVIEKIRSAKLFVLSSDYEGMPNALIEAMAVGLPVISTDCPCGGPAMLIEDGVSGLLVPVGDETILSKKLQLVLEDNRLAKILGTNARQIREKCAVRNVAMRWKAIIEVCVETNE